MAHPSTADVTSPQKTPTQLLQEYRAEASSLPPTEAKAAFAKALAATEKAYMELSGIRAAYATQYPTYTGAMLTAARAQHDEAMSAIDDADEVPDGLKAAIDRLHKAYGDRASTVARDLAEAIEGLDATRAPLAAAEAKVARARADLDRVKGFEKRAKGWFDDVKKLAEDVKSSRNSGSMRLAYAQYLELDHIYHKLILAHFGSDLPRSDRADPDWLLRRLNSALRALLLAEFERYEAHTAASDAAAQAKNAEAEFKSFVQDDGRRAAFLREAQDAVAESPANDQQQPAGRSDAADTSQSEPETVA
jgi:hypothetical protein